MNTLVNTIDRREFIRRFKNIMDSGDRFAFFIGAGCSISSGIPSAGSLTMEWLRELKRVKTGSSNDFEDWVKNDYLGCSTNPALFYGTVIEQLFPTHRERQREIEKRTERVDPGLGYAIFAQLLSHDKYGPHCNMVITTNFDDLIADALYLFTQRKPLVIYHESLATFVKISETKPIVIKIHGDARLSPKNTIVETENLDAAFEDVLKHLLQEVGLIFLGYGGNDESITKLLDNLPNKALPLGVYWVNDLVPETKFGEWLKKKDATWVQPQDFDELMLLIKADFDLPLPNQNRFANLFSRLSETLTQLNKTVNQKPVSIEKEELEGAISKAASEFKGPWAIIINASRDPMKAKSIYEKGLREFPNDKYIIASYANFLYDVHRDYPGAEKLYKKAAEIDPNYATNLANYANFLFTIRKDYDKAEELYQQAAELSPDNATNLANYANFLFTIRKDYDKAEELYNRAIEIAPNNVKTLGSYAGFLHDVLKDYDRAEELYNRAIEIDPNDAINLCSYAIFLRDVRKDYDKAEELYKRAADTNPNDAINLGSYARFLHDVRKDYDKAEELYERAADANPNDAINLGSYARFLHDVRKDYDKAEELYEKVKEIDPNNADTLISGNCATYLSDVRRDYDKFKEL